MQSVLISVNNFLMQELFLDNMILDLLLAVILLLAAYFLRRLPTKIISKLVRLQGFRENFEQRDQYKILLPAAALLVISEFLLTFPEKVAAFVSNLSYAFLIFALIYTLLSVFSAYVEVKVELDGEWQKKRGPAFFYLRLGKVFLWFLYILILLSIFGVNVSGLLTGVGLGGLAVSLAAQDSIANLIAGIILLNDDMISVGDDIILNNVSGTVLQMGLRSSRIRAYDRSIVNVPNKILAENILINVSRSDKRRVLFTVRLPLATDNELLGRLQEDIRCYWQENSRIDAAASWCSIDSIQENGIDFIVRFFVLSSEFSLMQEEKTKFLEFLWAKLSEHDIGAPSSMLVIKYQSSDLHREKEEVYLREDKISEEVYPGGEKIKKKAGREKKR